MKLNFEYWERAYFEGWLGKLLVTAFIGLIMVIIFDNYIEPWIIETLCRELVRCN
jgi:hypothetical protein